MLTGNTQLIHNLKNSKVLDRGYMQNNTSGIGTFTPRLWKLSIVWKSQQRNSKTTKGSKHGSQNLSTMKQI